jgi:uncharacterized membrane protein YfcA
MEPMILLPLFAWGVFVGVVFSTIGAAGGILTSFGMITLFAVTDPNSVKPMTQIVVLATALVFVPGYLRRAAAVIPLGLLLGAGGLVGAWVGSTLSSLYLSDMSQFRPLFGWLTIAVAMQIFWKLARSYAKMPGGPAPASAGDTDPSVSETRLSLTRLTFTQGGKRFQTSTWAPLLAGALIAMTASIFGVGGGFLLVPFMASLLGLPMHIIPATAAIAIFMSLTVSITNFLRLGAPLDWGLLLPITAGAVLGAILGPMVNRRLKNSVLQLVMGLIVAGIGMKYVLF